MDELFQLARGQISLAVIAKHLWQSAGSLAPILVISMVCSSFLKDCTKTGWSFLR